VFGGCSDPGPYRQTTEHLPYGSGRGLKQRGVDGQFPIVPESDAVIFTLRLRRKVKMTGGGE
jgi:hypothetical protein